MCTSCIDASKISADVPMISNDFLHVCLLMKFENHLLLMMSCHHPHYQVRFRDMNGVINSKYRQICPVQSSIPNDITYMNHFHQQEKYILNFQDKVRQHRYIFNLSIFGYVYCYEL